MIVEIGARDLVIEKEPSLQNQGPEDDVVRLELREHEWVGRLIILKVRISARLISLIG